MAKCGKNQGKLGELDYKTHLCDNPLMAKILVLHGPNLNLLGTREPRHYGKASLASIDQTLKTLAAEQHALDCRQSNAEDELINWVQQSAGERVDFMIINPAAFTHTSVALRDALSAVAIPFIEVHLSNVHAREPFRHQSYFSDIALGVITGLGAQGYEFAYHAAADYLQQNHAAASHLQRKPEYPCPIPGCSKIFHGSRGGWDAHVASLSRHPAWHPKVTDDEERKDLFRSEYPNWFKNV